MKTLEEEVMEKLPVLVLCYIQKVEEEGMIEDKIEAGQNPEKGGSPRTERILNVGIAKKKVTLEANAQNHKLQRKK
jgi:hypothetical protein